MSTATHDAKLTLDAHTQSIDELHAKLASMPGIDKARLQAAVDKYKASNLKFHEDVLGCMN